MHRVLARGAPGLERRVDAVPSAATGASRARASRGGAPRAKERRSDAPRAVPRGARGARGDGAPSTSTPDAPEMESGSAATAPELAPEAASGASEKKKPEARKPRTYQKVEMPTPEQMMMDDAMNNCVVKSVLATVMGGFLGAAMGIFFGAFEPTMPGDEKLSVAQSLKNAGRASIAKAASYAKGFAVFGALRQRVGVRGGADAREARHLQQRMRRVLHGGRHGQDGRAAGDGHRVRNDGGALSRHGPLHGPALMIRVA